MAWGVWGCILVLLLVACTLCEFWAAQWCCFVALACRLFVLVCGLLLVGCYGCMFIAIEFSGCY